MLAGRKTKRGLFVLLVTVTVLAMLLAASVRAYADGPVCEIVQTGESFATLDAALAEVADGQTIQLLDDVTLDYDWTIDNGLAFTLDTNDHTLEFGNHFLRVKGGSVVTFEGCSEIEGLRFVDVLDSGSNAVFNGNLVVVEHLWAYDSAEATVNGDIVSTAGSGVVARQASRVTVNGDITSWNYSIETAGPGSVVVVNGNTSSLHGTGMICFAGATVTVNGNVSATAPESFVYDIYGVIASEPDMMVTINGNVTGRDIGIGCDDSALITVNGDVTGGLVGVECVELATATVNGDVTSGSYGVYCEYGATVTVTGNVSATASEGIGVWCSGAYFESGEPSEDILRAQVFVGGDVAASGTPGFAAVAWINGQITIDGKVIATDDILVNGDAIADKNPTTLKATYDQYSDTPNGVLETITAVWVKAEVVVSPPVAPTINGPTAMDLTVGYKGTSTGLFTFTGTSPIIVKLAGNTGDGKITFNYETQKIDIASGLAAGTYVVTLTATNGVDPEAVHTFVLRVNNLPVTGDSALGLYALALLAAIGGLGLAGSSVLKRRHQIIGGLPVG